MSYLTLAGSAAPSIPATGKASHYVDDADGEPHLLNSQGVDSNLAPKWLYNYVRNSGFWFAQRTTPAGLSTWSNTTGRSISADGWGITNANASVQYIRTDTISAPESGLIGRYYGSFTKITSTGKIVLSQVLEGLDTAQLRGQTVRLQLWVKAIVSTTSPWIAGIAQLTSAGTVDALPATFISAFGANGVDPTLGTNLSYIAPKASIAADNATKLANGFSTTGTLSLSVWQRIGCVFDVPSNCENLVVMLWSDQGIAAASGIAVSQVSLTTEQAIQDWEPQAYQHELARVQRFYTKSFQIDTIPATSGGAQGQARGHVSVAGATAGQPLGIRFPVTMRVAPTMTFYNTTNGNAFVRNTTAATDATATAAANTNDAGTDITFTGLAAWTVAQAVAVNFSADAEL